MLNVNRIAKYQYVHLCLRCPSSGKLTHTRTLLTVMKIVHNRILGQNILRAKLIQTRNKCIVCAVVQGKIPLHFM